MVFSTFFSTVSLTAVSSTAKVPGLNWEMGSNRSSQKFNKYRGEKGNAYFMGFEKTSMWFPVFPSFPYFIFILVDFNSSDDDGSKCWIPSSLRASFPLFTSTPLQSLIFVTIPLALSLLRHFTTEILN